jgi:phage gpG-like protein
VSEFIRFDQRALEELFASPNGPAGKYLKRKAIQVQRGAKQRCPVDTGRLRASITEALGEDAQGLVARIGTNVEYARHVEFGTVRMRAQPFLRPGLRAAGMQGWSNQTGSGQVQRYTIDEGDE